MLALALPRTPGFFRGMARIKVTGGEGGVGAVVGKRLTAKRNRLSREASGRLDSKPGGGTRSYKARSRRPIHVSSTLRRGYPWQVASPQRLRPFRLADAPCHTLAVNSIRQSPDLICIAAPSQPGITIEDSSSVPAVQPASLVFAQSVVACPGVDLSSCTFETTESRLSSTTEISFRVEGDRWRAIPGFSFPNS